MRYLITLLFFLSGIGCFAQNYKAATYNIRMNTESDGINQWDNRKEWVTSQVLDLTVDVFGTQEGLPEQVSYLDSTLSNYDYAGVGRRDGVSAGEHSAIFYNKSNLQLLEEGTFWLSETPEKVSMGWDAANLRVCTFVLLKDLESDAHFWVFNAHLDHRGATARLEALKLIWERAESLNTQNYPMLVMGDFNAVPGSDPINFLSTHLNDSRDISQTKPVGPIGTFNGFDTTHPLEERIDYIFVSNDITVESYSVINEIKDNRTPSDHLPVVVEFTLKD
jgi:endonuclease/exonuclease/phosphatase family metal-dependent hydrolase